MSQAANNKFSTRYAMNGVDGAYSFHFYCALCAGGHTTGVIKADSLEAALNLARSEAREHFNGCHKCGKWICDEHYNIDEFMCADCAPIANDGRKGESA
jgi:hypothetical protein